MTAVWARRYAVTTHARCSRPPSSLTIVGRAVATMVPSSAARRRTMMSPPRTAPRFTAGSGSRSAPVSGARAALLMSGPRGLVVGEHRQVLHPGPDLVPVLLGHDPGYLGDVAEVVRHPGGEQLSQRDGAQTRVHGPEVELGVTQIPGAQTIEIRGAESAELVQERG